jgi:hypothetical protein
VGHLELLHARAPGGNDFLAHYTAWEAYLKLGLNPYSDAAALHTQQAIYGRPARPGEDQNRMTYPFYSIVVHGPFVYIEYPLARAIYMTLLQAALFLGVAATLALVKWQPPSWLLMLTLGWSLLFYPEARVCFWGSSPSLASLRWRARCSCCAGDGIRWRAPCWF